MGLEQLGFLDDLVIYLSKARKSLQERLKRDGGKDESEKVASGEAPTEIKGHQEGWANKQTEAVIKSDFTAGMSYDPKPGSPGGPPSIIDYIGGRHTVKSWREIIPAVFPKLPTEGKRFEKIIKGVESTGIAAAIRNKKTGTVMALPSKFLDKDKASTWSEFGVIAHEQGHLEQFKRIPKVFDPLTTPKLPMALAPIAGIFLGMSKAMPEIKPVARALTGIVAAGTAGFLAMETGANVRAKRDLDRYGAPASAYKTPMYSEMSYIGGAATISGSIMISSMVYQLQMEAAKSHGSEMDFLNNFLKKNKRKGLASVILTVGGMVATQVGGEGLLGELDMGKKKGKIAGHRSGWANKNTEETIQSDFTAGHSYMPRRFGPAGAALATSIVLAFTLFGNIDKAYAGNMVETGKTVPIEKRVKELKYLSNYTADLFGSKNLVEKTKVRNILYETALHESQRLEHRRQEILKDGKLVELGRGRSIFQIEPATAKNLVDWAVERPKIRTALEKASKVKFADLQRMNKDQLANLVMANDKFAAALARVKYLSVPGKIPSTLKGRSEYWAKYYMAGKDKAKKAEQYVTDAKAIREIIRNNMSSSKKVGKISSKMGNASYKATKVVANTLKTFARR